MVEEMLKGRKKNTHKRKKEMAEARIYSKRKFKYNRREKNYMPYTKPSHYNKTISPNPIYLIIPVSRNS